MENEKDYIVVGKISEEDRDLVKKFELREMELRNTITALGSELAKVQGHHQELWHKWIRENVIAKEKRNRNLFVEKSSLEIRARLWGWEDDLSKLEKKADELEKRLDEAKKER